MLRSAGSDLDRRLLMLAPTGRDAELMGAVLESAGVECLVCEDMRALCMAAREGAAAALIAEEALAEGAYHDLTVVLAQQPPWSDLPVLLLSERGADSDVITDALQSLGNVTVLERPTRVPTLVSAVHSALRSRNRQYQVRANIAEREQYADALHAADKRKDEFLATLAHELRNPLAPMRTALEIMRLAPRDEAAREQAQAILERQVRQMTRLIDDLLDVSRITHGKLTLKREHLPLQTVLDSALEITRPAMQALGHHLDVDVPGEEIYVYADPTRLAQVFSNLLNNAAKYTPQTGHIALRAARERDLAVVSVRDDGIGIAPENLQRVFEMFTQVGRSLEQARGGLGVGLSLSQWLVQLHGGSVEVRSAGVGKGSEFIVRLPIVTANIVVTQKAPALSVPRAENARRVLICDDNRDFAESLASVLRLAGHDVRVTYDGAEAITAARAWLPDVVLLDIGLPFLNGYETAERIHAALSDAPPLMVAITGWGQEEDRRRSRLAGFHHHFVKPIDPAALMHVLEETSEKRVQPPAARRVHAPQAPETNSG